MTLPGLVLLAAAIVGADCECTKAFDTMTATIESSYLAYHLDETARARYEKARPAARLRAGKAAPTDCHRVLADLVATFRDGHIFISEAPKLDPEETRALAQSASRVDWDEKRTRRYLTSQRLDPIEGFWYANDGSRYAIIRTPDGKGSRNQFVAFVLTTTAEGWRAGDVKARFTRLRDGSYDVTYHTRSRAAVHPMVYSRNRRGGAAIRNGVLLHMPPHTWGKEGAAVLDPKNPRAPTFRIHDARTAIFFIPSHSPEHQAALDALIEKNREAILKTDTLIIDIRGNEGGSSMMTRNLEPFYRSAKRETPQADRTVVLASDENIEVIRTMTEQGWPPKDVVARMQANRGKIVPLSIEEAADVAEAPVTEVLPMPRNVALLIDDAVVSAGEAFTAMIRNYERVTVFGDNTAGMIDYQTVRGWKRLGCERIGLSLGYPIMAASPDLPKGGFNAAGMPPDVRIPRGVDPIRFIAEYYARRSRRP